MPNPSKLVRQLTGRPTRKVKAAGIGGFVTALCVAGVDYFIPGAGEMIGPGIAGLIVAGGATVAGWFTRDERQVAAAE